MSTGQGAGPGDPGPPELDSYCGVALPAPQTTIFAAPAVIYERIQLFIFNQASPIPPELPDVTSREWAGETALTLLDSISAPSTPGMNRFVSSWWPGTATPVTWASYFGRGGTLLNLLTTPAGPRAGQGVLTDAVVLEQKSISARGAFIADHLLCSPIPPSPASIPPLPPLTEGMTRRMQLEQGLDNAACPACHSRMDPLGYSLEHFQDDGAFRDLDNGQPVNSASSFNLNYSGNITFADAAELARKIANSCEVTTCFTRQLMADAQRSAKLPRVTLDDREVAGIASSFSKSRLDLRGLIRAVVESDAFLRVR